MSRPLLFLDPDSDLGLQDQVRRKLVDAACAGAFPPGKRLPSSRALAAQLGVARNTVTLAYQKLLDEGLFISRERSGIYIDHDMLRGLTAVQSVAGGREPAPSSRWRGRFKSADGDEPVARRTPNWRQYPYPFIDGLFDASLFPVAEWREASRQALAVGDIGQWSMDGGDADDPMLIEEIRTKVLPRRGIQARPDEILVTVGAQQALSLVSRMLIDRTSVVAVEEPGYPDMRRLAMDRGARLVHQAIDDEGLVVDRRLDDCDLVYVTPSHQFPTGVMMTQARREALLRKAASRDLIIIEDDFACETNYLDEACPALRSLDRDDRVIYVAGFSKVLGPGLRLGFMVASAEVIAEARRLRHLTIRHPPLNNQRAGGPFPGHGPLRRNHDAVGAAVPGATHRAARRLEPLSATVHRHRATERRRDLLGAGPRSSRCRDLRGRGRAPGRADRARRALLRRQQGADEHLPARRDQPAPGPDTPGHRGPRGPDAGLAGDARAFPETAEARLSGEALRSTMSGAVLLCKTVYGDPCTIELLPDGRMVAGPATPTRIATKGAGGSRATSGDASGTAGPTAKPRA